MLSSPGSGGLGWGLVGVAAFSLTVPLTRITVQDGAMSAMFAGIGRAVVAALLAAVALAVTRQRRPRGTQWWRLAVVAGGVVIGFPVLTAYALTTTSAAHSAVVIALLPAATAVAAVVRGRERPPRSFWITAGVAAAAAVGFAALRSGGLGGLHGAGLLLLGAVVAAAIGYAEGGLLARELGSWQTISWALVLSAPVTTAVTVVAVAEHPPTGAATEWAAFAYLAVVSMFLGFFAWYRGLAIGPMTRVSQIQLTQPVMTICWAALLLGEQPTTSVLVGGAAVILCAATAVRSRSAPVRPL
ncbi:MAG: DMT family transporter [Rhodococcus zopfii]|nr:DMT family transporter [Rhodococcus zopfii]